MSLSPSSEVPSKPLSISSIPSRLTRPPFSRPTSSFFATALLICFGISLTSSLTQPTTFSNRAGNYAIRSQKHTVFDNINLLSSRSRSWNFDMHNVSPEISEDSIMPYVISESSPTDSFKRSLLGISRRSIFTASASLLALTGRALIAKASMIDSTNKKGPEITEMVFLQIKIANYTEESVGTNKGARGSGRLLIGLYGRDAPESVKRFLSMIDSDGENYPSFYNSQFAKVSSDGTLLELEKVRGVNKVSIAGSEQYEYNGNILTDFLPILESNAVRHTKRGLLTRMELSSGPEFGITLREAPNLDGFHVVFGEVLDSDEESQGVLDAISRIPLYTYKTKTGYAGGEKKTEEDGGLADQWFEAQRKLYVDLGKSFGDTRAIDLRGKLLTRVSIKGAGRLPK